MHPQNSRRTVWGVCLAMIAIGTAMLTREIVFPEPGAIAQRAVYCGVVVTLCMGAGLLMFGRIEKQHSSR